MSYLKSIDVVAKIYDMPNVPKVKAVIPITLNQDEIINFLRFSHKMEIPDDYIIAIVRNDNTNSYVLGGNERPLLNYSHQKNLEIVFFPGVMTFEIVSPDKTVTPIIIKTQYTVDKIIELYCMKMFNISETISYALYDTEANFLEPLPNNKAIIEINPNLKSLYFGRRIWTKSLLNIKNDVELYQIFFQAINIIFSSDFFHSYYNIPELLSIYMVYKLDTSARALIFLKKSSKKQITTFITKY